MLLFFFLHFRGGGLFSIPPPPFLSTLHRDWSTRGHFHGLVLWYSGVLVGGLIKSSEDAFVILFKFLLIITVFLSRK